MSEEHTTILTMLSEGTITVDEAEKLLKAVGSKDGGFDGEGPEYLRVETCCEGDDAGVNMRIPIKFIRAGLKLGSLIPHASGKVGLKNKKLREAFKKIEKKIRKKSRDCCENLDDLLAACCDISIKVGGKETVRVTSE